MIDHADSGILVTTDERQKLFQFRFLPKPVEDTASSPTDVVGIRRIIRVDNA